MFNMNLKTDSEIVKLIKVQYFGAIAIHYKITHCWVELPPDKVDFDHRYFFKMIY